MADASPESAAVRADGRTDTQIRFGGVKQCCLLMPETTTAWTWQSVAGHCCASGACFRGQMALRGGVKAIAAFLRQCMDPAQQSPGRRTPSKLWWKWSSNPSLAMCELARQVRCGLPPVCVLMQHCAEHCMAMLQARKHSISRSSGRLCKASCWQPFTRGQWCRLSCRWGPQHCTQRLVLHALAFSI